MALTQGNRPLLFPLGFMGPEDGEVFAALPGPLFALLELISRSGVINSGQGLRAGGGAGATDCA